MHLKKIDISGFKSFARKTSLELTQGITAIVGPNGSGKSNIADAIRWATGEQSIKTLRAKKSEDVIFSGSDKKTRLGLAEVSLHLDNGDKKIPLDYSEVSLTRRIYRNGESSYLINNAKSKLSDINLLLTKANFGHRTYSVIGQGMIDNFLLSSPAERKEFFEEATGVKQYQIKKNQALQKLEAVWQNLNTLKIKISEMEPRLNLLTRQVKKLNKRKEIESQLHQARLAYYSPYWQEIDAGYTSQQTSIDKLNLVKDKVYASWQDIKDKFDKLTKNNSSNHELNQLRDQEQKLLDKKISLKEKLLTHKISQTKNVSLGQTQLKTISRQDILGLNQKIEELGGLHKKIVDQLNRENNLEFFKQEIVNLNKKINALLLFLKPYISPAPKVDSLRKDDGQDYLKKIEEQISANNQDLSALQLKIKNLQDHDSQERSNLWQLQKDFQEAQAKLNEINSQINELRVNLARTETKRFDLKAEIQYELGGLENLEPNQDKTLTEQEKITAHNKLNRLKNQLEIIGGLDPEIEAEYLTTQERYDFLTGQIEDLTSTSHSLKKLVGQLETIIRHQVNKSFTDINKNFQKYFQTIFNGGRAELKLIKTEEKDEVLPSAEDDDQKNTATNFFQEKNRVSGFTGIEVQATPPGKKLKSIGALSGGERSLVSIALICAIISSNPSPFVVLDEVDAALDESNSIRFAEIIQNLSHKTQFIIITHNRATIEKGKIIYGVTMSDDGVSKLISIKLEDAEKYKSH